MGFLFISECSLHVVSSAAAFIYTKCPGHNLCVCVCVCVRACVCMDRETDCVNSYDLASYEVLQCYLCHVLLVEVVAVARPGSRGGNMDHSIR